MTLEQIELEVWLPSLKTVKVPAEIMSLLFPNGKKEDVEFRVPRIWKMSLTEKSEMLIFGNVRPYRMDHLPPLPWGNEQYYARKKALIDDTQADIYNARIKLTYKNKPELIVRKLIQPGVVEVFRGSLNVVLNNA